MKSSYRSWRSLVSLLIFVLQIFIFTCVFISQKTNSQSHDTSGKRYEEGYCSMYDICGQRSDGKVLNCPNGSRSIKPNNMLSLKIQSLCPTITGNACCTEEQFSTLRQQVQQAIPLLVGCPACLRNFLNLFCELTCSPNQSLFINVTSISEVNKSRTVDGIEYFVTEYFAKELYNSCKDVKFGSTNMRAMDFIGAGAQNYKDWFAFLGRQAGLNQIGSPYSITFQSKIINSSLAKPMNVSAYSCGDSTLGCSCGDCQSSPECSDFSPLSLPKKSKCSTKIGSLEVKCIELSSTVLYIILISIFLLWVLLYKKRKRTSPSPINQHFRGAKEEIGSHSPDKKAKPNSQSQDLIEDHNQVYRLKSSLIQDYLSIWFRWYGKWVARNPILVLCFSLAIPLLLSLGLIHFRVETRPEKLWVGSGSKAAEDKQFFDSHLAPFYRIEQLILATISDTKNGEQPRILNDKNMQLLFEIQKKIDGLKVNYSGSVVSLSDICLNPLGNACATQSVLQYYKMDPKKYNELGGVDHVKYCFEHYSSADACLSAFKAPLDPSTALGGFAGKNYSEASSFIITYPVNNKFDSSSSANGKAMSWEKAFIRLIKEEIKPMVNSHNLSISFSSESSIQEELKRSSSADVITILVSYILMSVYISFALADIPNFSSFFISSKALLGFSGIVVVILSVLGSAGFFSAIGIKSTLIIMEVIPFLVLAVGVDNMCILVHAVKRQPLDLLLEETISNALVEVGPSITLASLSEVVAFAVGSFIPMPACRVFSMFAALAVFLDFLLQISAFLSLIVFDFLRARDNRIDCFPCIKVHSSNPNNNVTRERKRGFLSRYMKDIHAPILGLFWVKIIVVILFTAAAFSSIALCTRIQPGLEQKIVLPQDSYLQDYFDDLTDYLRIGPPLYFVVKNFNYSMESRQTNQLCSISQCDSGSLLNEIARASLTSELSYIAKPAASWLDDFLIWLSPEAFSCCRKFTNGSYCPPNDQPPCCSSSDRSCNLGTVCKDCTTCFLHSDLQKGRPSTLQFKEKLPWFLNSSPSADCAKGGIGAYTSNLNLSDYQSGIISASAFRTYHPPLNKQVDYVKALRAARDFSAKMTDSLKIEIFPYSVFYIFFEQYLDIWKTALVNLSICLGAVFIVCLIITSSFWSSAIILVVLTMIVLDIMGIMALLGIQLNAISVVNLVMSVGIAVEFCVHIMHAFLISSGDREKRASKSLNTMGASVFSGITLTKLVGVVVLRMARSEIFVIYYFQMYLALVLIGFLHGLIFLPVVLSLCGPPSRNNHIEDVQND